MFGNELGGCWLNRTNVSGLFEPGLSGGSDVGFPGNTDQIALPRVNHREKTRTRCFFGLRNYSFQYYGFNLTAIKFQFRDLLDP